MGALARRRPSGEGNLSFYDRHQRKLAPYLFVAPFFVLFVVFFVGPILFAVYASFTKWSGFGWPQWTGLTNYVFMLTLDTTFWKSLENTAVYVVANQVMVIPVALVAALALNAGWLRFKDAFRIIYFIPVFTTGVVVAIVFGLIYSKDYGFLNFAIRSVGFAPVDWVGDPTSAKIAIIVVMIWRRLGFVMIFFLAGLQAIPRYIVEAAMVDGADRWAIFRQVTLPLLRPIVLFVLITGIIGAFQTFEEPFLITGGGPSNETLSLAEYLYNRAFTDGSLGYASTVGMALFFIIFIFSYVQVQWLGAFRDED
jgi:multiple sugar transport system permease protein